MAQKNVESWFATEPKKSSKSKKSSLVQRVHQHARTSNFKSIFVFYDTIIIPNSILSDFKQLNIRQSPESTTEMQIIFPRL